MRNILLKKGKNYLIKFNLGKEVVKLVNIKALDWKDGGRMSLGTER